MLLVLDGFTIPIDIDYLVFCLVKVLDGFTIPTYIDFLSVFPGKGIPSFLGPRKRYECYKSTYATKTLLLEGPFKHILYLSLANIKSDEPIFLYSKNCFA